MTSGLAQNLTLCGQQPFTTATAVVLVERAAAGWRASTPTSPSPRPQPWSSLSALAAGAAGVAMGGTFTTATAVVLVERTAQPP
jgi:hypothetical protein